jgi:hypothetical protein
VRLEVGRLDERAAVLIEIFGDTPADMQALRNELGSLGRFGLRAADQHIEVVNAQGCRQRPAACSPRVAQRPLLRRHGGVDDDG